MDQKRPYIFSIVTQFLALHQLLGKKRVEYQLKQDILTQTELENIFLQQLLQDINRETSMKKSLNALKDSLQIGTIPYTYFERRYIVRAEHSLINVKPLFLPPLD